MSLSPDELDAIADAATLGPWEAEALGSEGYGVFGVRGRGLGRRHRITLVGYGEWEQDKADARLIALAPTLARDLAALQRWAEKARGWLQDVGCEQEWEANRTPCDYGDDRSEWCRRCALLAEYAEMKEGT